MVSCGRSIVSVSTRSLGKQWANSYVLRRKRPRAYQTRWRSTKTSLMGCTPKPQVCLSNNPHQWRGMNSDQEFILVETLPELSGKLRPGNAQ